MIFWLSFLVGCQSEPLPKSSVQPPTEASPPKPTPLYGVTNVNNLELILPRKTASYSPAVTLTVEQQSAVKLMKDFINLHGLRANNPWALLHALLASNEDKAVEDGRLAIDALFADYAQIKSIQGVDFPTFPRKVQKDTTQIPVEPHKDLALKVFTEINVAPTRKVIVKGRQFTIADLYKGTLISTHLLPQSNESSYSSPNDMPWSVQALSSYVQPGIKWSGPKQSKMSVEFLSTFIAAILKKESQFLLQAQKAGATFEKKRQGIFQYTCGGAHLLQSLAYVQARGFGSEKVQSALKEQAELLYYRYPIELKIYTQALQANPSYQYQLLIQRLKFVGHFIESSAKLTILGHHTPNQNQKRLLQSAVVELTSIIQTLHQLGVLQQPQKLQNRQLYYDLIGDMSHAVHAIELLAGKRSISY